MAELQPSRKWNGKVLAPEMLQYLVFVCLARMLVSLINGSLIMNKIKYIIDNSFSPMDYLFVI